MTLKAIEEIILVTIGYDRYSSLSADTNAEKIEDFSFLHRCVWLAREEIKVNTLIPSILKRSSANKTTAGTKAYSLPTDFDIPVKVRYRSASSEFDLDRVYPENLMQKLGGNLTTTQGTPSLYMIFGNSSDVAQIELYLIPDTTNQEYDVEYKPVLANLTTSTDEDLIMNKYPLTVIKFATAYAFQFIKKDDTGFDKYFLMGMADLPKINLREINSDSLYKELPDPLTRRRRQTRFSQ